MKQVYASLLLIACFALIAFVAWKFGYAGSATAGDAPQNSLFDSEESDTSTTVLSPSGTSTVLHRDPPSGYKEYNSVRYHFSLFYPEDLVVKTHEEGGNAFTLTFQNIQNAKGFQIFVVPYSKSSISEEKFIKDEPSGVRENLSNIQIDGATGASFYSKNAALGDTAEVWFIHDGYLYEVTTLKPLDAWLSGILASWKFLP